MKKLAYIVILLFAITFAQAQNDMKARIEFEDAEKAFEKGDYETALKHIKETEKLIGKWTPITSFLKVESLYAITDMADFFDSNMQSLYEEVNKYMAHMNKLHSDDVPIEKYKKTYEIEKILNVHKLDERQSPEFIKAREEKNDSVKISLYKRLAQKGNGWAMRNLGVSFENIKENDQAIEWYKKAVENGNSQAAIDLAKIDKDNGRKWYEQAGRMEHPYGIYALGWYAEYYDENPQKAMEYYQQAADKGSSQANIGVAYLYKEGKGVAQDYAKAWQYYKKAAQKGNSYGFTGVGLLYHSGGNGIDQNLQIAMEWYLEASERGNTEAMFHIGWIYQNGSDGFAKDYAKAEQWYNRMLKEGDKDAYVFLGALYSLSDNDQPQKALENYEKAAEVGYSSGILETANLYYSGKGGLERDYTKAAKHYERYYELIKKNESYLDNLIEIYNRGGYGVEKDKEKTKYWRNIRRQY